MSGPVSFATLTTTLPTSDDERGRLMRNVSERDQQLYDYGRSGYRLAASVTVPGSDVVTVIDTLTRESDSDGDGR
ncbi:hypothetical protein PSET11_03305 [Arthrobacter ulcerisalmonis]|uniref:Uncharacterized protein n=1 Tax=Arthrobacter ulcerisalmonis TaxID=2483813 RepID=A0A3P5XYQ5_9MICC|nr:hypothetical protein [Arthrobacter ulcerisalmonis]VDC33283.1 hypothetical protein PSET11_03305 [Arthrobacter ulcerisalmonis]